LRFWETSFDRKSCERRTDTGAICIRGCKEGERRSAFSFYFSAISIIKTARRINRPFCARRPSRNAVEQRGLMLRIKPEVRSSEKGPPYANFYFAASEIFRRYPSQLYLYSRPSGVTCGTLSGLISSSHSIFTGDT